MKTTATLCLILATMLAATAQTLQPATIDMDTTNLVFWEFGGDVDMAYDPQANSVTITDKTKDPIVEIWGYHVDTQTGEIWEAPSFEYCEIRGTARLMSNKVTVVVDFGQEMKAFQDARIRDAETGKVESFNSMVDALNYMAAQGWEFVQAYAVASAGGPPVYHWLMRRPAGQ